MGRISLKGVWEYVKFMVWASLSIKSIIIPVMQKQLEQDKQTESYAS